MFMKWVNRKFTHFFGKVISGFSLARWHLLAQAPPKKKGRHLPTLAIW